MLRWSMFALSLGLSVLSAVVSARIAWRNVWCAYSCEDDALRRWLTADLDESWSFVIFFGVVSAAAMALSVRLFRQVSVRR